MSAPYYFAETTEAPPLAMIEHGDDIQHSNPHISVKYLKDGRTWVGVSSGVHHFAAYSGRDNVDASVSLLLKLWRGYAQKRPA